MVVWIQGEQDVRGYECCDEDITRRTLSYTLANSGEMGKQPAKTAGRKSGYNFEKLITYDLYIISQNWRK
jgi:hypothetical protein